MSGEIDWDFNITITVVGLGRQMAQAEKLSCRDLGLNRGILGFGTSSQVLGSRDKLPASCDLIFPSVKVDVAAS